MVRNPASMSGGVPCTTSGIAPTHHLSAAGSGSASVAARKSASTAAVIGAPHVGEGSAGPYCCLFMAAEIRGVARFAPSAKGTEPSGGGHR